MNFLPARRGRSPLVIAGPLVCGLAAVAVGFVGAWAMAGVGRAVPVELPRTGSTAAELEANFAGHVITVRRDGSYLLGGGRLPRAELAARLNRLGKLPAAADERILIRADAGAPFEGVADLLEMCRAAGLRSVSFEVLEESAP
ncbi:MAG: ExbD/TolR family protein [Planctomycetota bacterium]|jgi:biopolymer transport protein ExbD